MRSRPMAARRSFTRSRSIFSRERTVDSRRLISICRTSLSRVASSRSLSDSACRFNSLSLLPDWPGSDAINCRASRSCTAISCSICCPLTFRRRLISASSLGCESEPERSGRESASAGRLSEDFNATDRTSDAPTLSGSRRSDASASRTADACEPADSACRESSARAMASSRIAPRANSKPSRPSSGRKTPLLSLALAASSKINALSARGVAEGISSTTAADRVPPHSSTISSCAAESRPSTSTIESRSLRSGGRRPGSMRMRGSGASVENTTSSGQLTGAIAKAPKRLPASLAETFSPGVMSIPPVALAIAARHGQLIWAPMPTPEKVMCFDRRVSTTR